MSVQTFDRSIRSEKRAGSLWKFNVSRAHLSACVQHEVFGVRRNYNLVLGDLILLQQKKEKGVDPHSRVTHVLEFTRLEEDLDGTSETLWGEHYPYLIRGTVQTLVHPFSLEDLPLSKPYSAPGMMNHERIAELDEGAVLEAIDH